MITTPDRYSGMTKAEVVAAAARFMPAHRITATSSAQELWNWYVRVDPSFADGHRLARNLPAGMTERSPGKTVVDASDLWGRIAKAVLSVHEREVAIRRGGRIAKSRKQEKATHAVIRGRLPKDGLVLGRCAKR